MTLVSFDAMHFNLTNSLNFDENKHEFVCLKILDVWTRFLEIKNKSGNGGIGK